MDIGNSSTLFLHKIMCLLAIYKSGEVRKTDVMVAKNYLRENELKELNRIVNMRLDFAEDQALAVSKYSYKIGILNWISF